MYIGGSKHPRKSSWPAARMDSSLGLVRYMAAVKKNLALLWGKLPGSSDLLNSSSISLFFEVWNSHIIMCFWLLSVQSPHLSIPIIVMFREPAWSLVEVYFKIHPQTSPTSLSISSKSYSFVHRTSNKYFTIVKMHVLPTTQTIVHSRRLRRLNIRFLSSILFSFQSFSRVPKSVYILSIRYTVNLLGRFIS